MAQDNMPGGNEAPPRRQIGRAAVAIVTVGWLFLLTVYLRSPSVHAALVNSRAENTLVLFDPARDPASGSLIALPFQDILGRKLTDDSPLHGGRFVLIAAGGCQSCTEKKLNSLTLGQRTALTIVLVFEGTPAEVKREVRGWPANVRLVADPDSKITHLLNVQFFQPRGFILDSSSRVVSSQGYGEDLGKFLEESNAT